jgi:hypothetical protein
MKRLLGLGVLFVVLSMCVPSYGYMLVYNVTGGIKAAEWYGEKLISVSVKGYLALDIDSDSNVINDTNMVLYGKDASGNLVYYKESRNLISSAFGMDWSTTGGIVGFDAWDDSPPFNYHFMMTGAVKATDVGLGANSKRPAASSLKGSLVSWWAQLLDGDQMLFGSGAATMKLDIKQTKAANAANVSTPGSVTVRTIISDCVDLLIDKHYNQLAL